MSAGKFARPRLSAFFGLGFRPPLLIAGRIFVWRTFRPVEAGAQVTHHGLCHPICHDSSKSDGWNSERRPFRDRIVIAAATRPSLDAGAGAVGALVAPGAKVALQGQTDRRDWWDLET